mgnify:CR=1 FL=1
MRNVPEMLTVSPVLAHVGEKLVIVGAGIKVKPHREAVPSAESSATLPEAPAPTTALRGDPKIKDAAGTPPNVTPVMSGVPVA